MRHLLALVEAPDHVAYRYRLAAYGSALAREGWSLDPLVAKRGMLPLIEQLQAAAAADAVVLQRRLWPWWRLAMLRKVSKLLIFDVDDAIFYRDSNSRKPVHSQRRLARFQNTVRQVDAVTAGNNFLLDEAAARGAGDRAQYFPTCVETDHYRQAMHYRRGAECRLVWIGSRGTATSLYVARPALAAAAERLPGLELRMICDWFPDLAGVRVAPRTWSGESEIAELADGDIGMSWLPEHPWSLGKCGLKVLQYMAAGLPVVVNPIGIHRQLVVHGQTGFFASTPQQWSEAIYRLAMSPELRTTMGQAAQRFVSEHFGSGLWATRFAALLNRLSGVKRRMAAAVPGPHWHTPHEAAWSSASPEPAEVMRGA